MTPTPFSCPAKTPREALAQLAYLVVMRTSTAKVLGTLTVSVLGSLLAGLLITHR